eukprot:Skav220901  [mRNA]  locus=scaffold3880:191225:197256:+ [translate_table: standard]
MVPMAAPLSLPPAAPAPPGVPPLPPPAAPLVPYPVPPAALPAQPLVQLPPMPELSHLGPEDRGDIPKLTTAPPPPPAMSEEDATKAMLKWLSPGEMSQRHAMRDSDGLTRSWFAGAPPMAFTAAGTSMADHAMQQQIMKHQRAAAALAGAPAPAPAPAAKQGAGSFLPALKPPNGTTVAAFHSKYVPRRTSPGAFLEVVSEARGHGTSDRATEHCFHYRWPSTVIIGHEP